jgi:hypothetical protein
VEPTPPRRYAPDDAHPANRLHQALFVRTDLDGTEYGHQEIDPHLWPETSAHLLAADTNEKALKALDSFTRIVSRETGLGHAARALLQRDLWAAFDWAASRSPFAGASPIPARVELRRSLMLAIRQVALDSEETAELPDTYLNAVQGGEFPGEFDPAQPDRPFLPPDLLDPRGSWVCRGERSFSQYQPNTRLVPRHVEHFSRSTFLVLIRLPGGRDATLDYLQRLVGHSEPLVVAGGRVALSPSFPEFSPGTQVALVGRAMLISSSREIVPTRIVESIQIRTYAPDQPYMDGRHEHRQRVVEFVLSPARFLANEKAAIRAIAPDERGFNQFGSFSDPFEDRDGTQLVDRPIVHRSCLGCHESAGVRGFNTYTRSFGSNLPAPLMETSVDARQEASIWWKQTRYDWGLLCGMWGG